MFYKIRIYSPVPISFSYFIIVELFNLYRFFRCFTKSKYSPAPILFKYCIIVELFNFRRFSRCFTRSNSKARSLFFLNIVQSTNCSICDDFLANYARSKSIARYLFHFLEVQSSHCSVCDGVLADYARSNSRDSFEAELYRIIFRMYFCLWHIFTELDPLNFPFSNLKFGTIFSTF